MLAWCSSCSNGCRWRPPQPQPRRQLLPAAGICLRLSMASSRHRHLRRPAGCWHRHQRPASAFQQSSAQVGSRPSVQWRHCGVVTTTCPTIHARSRQAYHVTCVMRQSAHIVNRVCLQKCTSGSAICHTIECAKPFGTDVMSNIAFAARTLYVTRGVKGAPEKMLLKPCTCVAITNAKAASSAAAWRRQLLRRHGASANDALHCHCKGGCLLRPLHRHEVTLTVAMCA